MRGGPRNQDGETVPHAGHGGNPGGSVKLGSPNYGLEVQAEIPAEGLVF